MKHRLLICLLLALFGVLFLHTAWENSPTWDEVGYLGLGAYLFEHGRWDVPAACSHPPLAYYLHGLPALLYPLDPAPWRYPDRPAGDLGYLRSADPARGNAVLLDPAYDGERLFFYCRAASLAFAALLFSVLHRWAGTLYGPGRAVLVLFLLALLPEVLAHGPLITTDFALATTFVAAAYAFRQLVRQPSPGWLLAAGGSLGLALLSKLSALVLVPALALTLAAFLLLANPVERQAFRCPLLARGRAGSVWLQALAAYLVVLLAAGLTVWAGYGFRVEPYLLTLRSQQGDLAAGHEAYLMGRYSAHGWWYYYPLAFLIKTPLPLLLLGGLGLWVWWRDRGVAPRQELVFLLLPPLLLAATFLWGGKDIGLRYLLPVYPFLCLLAGRALPCPGAAWRKYLLVGLCAWYAVGTLRIHPHHLSYFNELVGGPANGYHYLVDSNLDWGQDLKGLKRYMDRQGIERIKLSYFGTVDPALYGLQYDWLPSFVLPVPPGTQAAMPATGLIAISATNLVGVYLGGYGHGRELFAYLRRYAPIARIGYSIFVYRIPEQTVPAP